jgi:tetratricopeptide (TPR) repeat protein
MPVTTNEVPSPAPALAFARLLLENHDLIARGKGDTPEAEALADRMDGPWYAMTEQEQKRMRGLSADLHTLHEDGPKRVEMPPDQIVAWRQAVREASGLAETGNADAFLDFLRKPVPSIVPRSTVFYLQARCWEKLGDLQTALLFMREAERLDPEHAISVLILLQYMHRWEEAAEQAERLIGKGEASSAELYLAAASLLALTQTASDDEAAPHLKRALDVLNRAETAPSHRLSTEREAYDLDINIACALGLCHERLGNASAAVEVYSRALKAHPSSSQLLTMRGLALYPHNIPSALRDFVLATRAGARLIWPWYILASHSLAEGAYGDALWFAIQASERPGNSSARAETYETIAIALARLGEPIARVLENLEMAARLDPANERIRANLELVRGDEKATRDWTVRLSGALPSARQAAADRHREIASQPTSYGKQREDRRSDALLEV